MKYNPYKYQFHGYKHILLNAFAGLFLDMGLGKTIITLTAIADLIDLGIISKVLIVGPKAVVRDTWFREIAKWNHTKHLKAVLIDGDPKRKSKLLSSKADIFLISRDSLHSLGSQRFDMLVLDESSAFKDGSTRRFKILKKFIFKRVVLLTGTPSPNSLLDLWSQLFLIDKGLRLEKFMITYKEKYFAHISDGAFGKYVIRDSIAETQIHNRISDVCISMKSEDYLDLPACQIHNVDIAFSESLRIKYKSFEREYVMELAGKDIIVQNAMVLSGKLMQFTSGAIYDNTQTSRILHGLKLDALEAIVEAADSPVLVFYHFIHEAERITARLPQSQLFTTKKIEAWNRGEIPVMLANPLSAGHGLNLQDGGHIAVWFTPTWSLDRYEQANKRLDRQGQKFPVHIYNLIIDGSIDQRVLKALAGKRTGQNALIEAVKALVDEYTA